MTSTVKSVQPIKYREKTFRAQIKVALIATFPPLPFIVGPTFVTIPPTVLIIFEIVHVEFALEDVS